MSRSGEGDPPPRERHPGDRADDVVVWALPPWRVACHWGAVALLAGVVVLAARNLLHDGLRVDATVWFVLATGAVVQIAGLLRAVVAVSLEPTGTLTLFRAAGGSLRTDLDRLRRLDRGWLAAAGMRPREHTRRGHRLRLITDDGAATLSVFFPDPSELALDLLDHRPDLVTDL